MGVEVCASGFGVWDVGSVVWGLGFGIWGLRFEVSGLGIRVRESGMRLSGFRGLGLWGFGVERVDVSAIHASPTLTLNPQIPKPAPIRIYPLNP